jgi:hypothetical protein
MYRRSLRAQFGFISVIFFALVAVLSFGILKYGATSAHAQTDTATATTGADPLTLDVSPQYPTPYSSITITPSSSIFDISQATISVTKNGTQVYSGSGGEGIAVSVDGAGVTDTIVLTATVGGQSYSKSVTVRPADVALVVEPVSSTHPFYAGASLVPSEGHVRVVAIPDLRTASGKQYDPASLVYTWSLGDQELDADSGIGKSVLDAIAPQQYRDADVSLTVASQDGAVMAQADETISPISPTTRIYEEDPLLGPLYENALGSSYTMPDAEDTFLGVPYYFSSTPTLDWTMNGTDSGSTDALTVRDTGTGVGTAQLSFTANDSSSNETANSTLSVQFGSTSSTGLFGL